MRDVLRKGDQVDERGGESQAGEGHESLIDDGRRVGAVEEVVRHDDIGDDGLGLSPAFGGLKYNCSRIQELDRGGAEMMSG